jgi:hypothetical protein
MKAFHNQLGKIPQRGLSSEEHIKVFAQSKNTLSTQSAQWESR